MPEIPNPQNVILNAAQVKQLEADLRAIADVDFEETPKGDEWVPVLLRTVANRIAGIQRLTYSEFCLRWRSALEEVECHTVGEETATDWSNCFAIMFDNASRGESPAQGR